MKTSFFGRLYIVILMVFFVPSHKIAPMLKQKFPTRIPTHLPAGAPLFLKLQAFDRFERIVLGDKTLSQVPDLNTLIGSIDLYGPEVVPFTAYWKRQRTISALSLIYSPPIRWFHTQIRVQRKSLKDAPKLNIAPKVWRHVTQSKEEQRILDREIMAQLWENESGSIINQCWQRPIQSKTVSQFGAPRKLPDGTVYRHSGLDLRARKGTPIMTIGPGSVIFASQTVIGGNVVVIYHGQGIHSRYMHLDQIKVQEGQEVSKNFLLGLAGNTGRVEAAHLHWEIIWKGQFVNPTDYLRGWEQICDQG